jgi:hypothetical protein
MPQKLTRLKIEEVSSVDAGAGEGVKVVLMKRAPVTGDELRGFLDDQVREGKLPGIDNTAPRRAAPSSPHPPGRAMPRPATHEDDLMDTFSSIVRDHGLAKVAKAIAAGTSARAVTEHEFVAEVTKYARRVYPDLSPDVAFAKVFAAGDERAQVLSKAVAVVKSRAWIAKAKAPIASDDKLDGVEDGDREDMGAYGERAGDGALASASVGSSGNGGRSAMQRNRPTRLAA